MINQLFKKIIIRFIDTEKKSSLLQPYFQTATQPDIKPRETNNKEPTLQETKKMC